MAHYYGTSGDDTITGTRHADRFDMSQGGNDTVSGGGGTDYFYFGAAFTADDHIDGGLTKAKHQAPVALSTVELDGDYSAGVVFGASTMINVAHLVLDAGHSYCLTTNAATVGGGQVLEVNAKALGAGDVLTFDNSAGTAGSILVESNAGRATIIGGAGNDTFFLGATLNSSDHIDGGAGSNTLSISGDYSATLALDGSWFSNIGTLSLNSAAGSYSFTVTSSVVAPGKTMLIQGTDSGHPANLNFDGSAETAGSFSFLYVNGDITGGQGADQFNSITGTVTGGGGDDTFQSITGTVNLGDGSQVRVNNSTGTFNGGAGNDTYYQSSGTFNGGSGNQSFQNCSGIFNVGSGDQFFQSCSGTFNGGSGNQQFQFCSGTFNLENSSTVSFYQPNQQSTLYMGASLNADDSINGNGLTTVVLDGDYSAGLSLSNVAGINTFLLTVGHSYHFPSGAFFALKHATATVDGSQLGEGDNLIFDGSANGQGRLVKYGGWGDDTLIGSATSVSTLSGGHGQDNLKGGIAGDTLTGGGGADTLDGGSGGNDKFIYAASSDSSGIHYDTIIGFDVTRDVIKTPVRVTGVDAIITGGALDNTHADAFNNDLAAAADSAHLAVDHAVLFEPNSGNLAGHIFLIVDQNGIAGYQANEDLVIDVTQSSNITSLSIHDFH